MICVGRTFAIKDINAAGFASLPRMELTSAGGQSAPGVAAVAHCAESSPQAAKCPRGATRRGKTGPECHNHHEASVGKHGGNTQTALRRNRGRRYFSHPRESHNKHPISTHSGSPAARKPVIAFSNACFERFRLCGHARYWAIVKPGRASRS